KRKYEEGKQRGNAKRQLKNDYDIYSKVVGRFRNAERKNKLFDEREIVSSAENIQSPELKTKLETLYTDALNLNKKLRAKGIKDYGNLQQPTGQTITKPVTKEEKETAEEERPEE